MREVMIGFDPRERRAYQVCARSIIENTSIPPIIRPIGISTLGSMYCRKTETRDGKLYDKISDAPMSTEFAIARFYLPLIAHSHVVLFCDADFMFRADLEELFDRFDSRYAVQVVKNQHKAQESVKMDGQIQTDYPRKNWSSLMLWNMKHAGTRRLWFDDVTTKKGLWLHQFSWLKDNEIGELPVEWNHLVGVNQEDENAKAVHFTQGTPDMPGYENCEFAKEWLSYDSRIVAG